MKTTVKRRFLCILFALMMLMSSINMAYAAGTPGADASPMAGTETWYTGSGYVGNFYLSSSNLTPIKTMGNSGTLRVYGSARSNNNGNPWWIKVQIKDEDSGKVIAENTSTPHTDSNQAYSVSLSVTKGQQIRIYMYYVTKPANDAYIDICYILK